MDRSDPAFAWLHAAELAACVREASRWDWDDDQRRLLKAVVELSERLYEGADPGGLISLFEEVEEALLKDRAVRLWLASIDDTDVGRTMQRARKAFSRLRYLLFEEGPPVAA